MTKQHTLGFIGIGLMGKPLTLRLLRAGFQVNVWNRTKDKLTTVVNEGAIAFDDLSELANASEVIILCLANTEVVESVVENKLFSTKSAGKLVIDLSSIDPETTKRLAQQLKKQYEVRWVDAPVSGGTLGAEQGTLAIMAGGDANDIAIAKNVLQPLYSQLTHMGELGSGQVTKICNQMIVSCNVMVIAEMMALAKKSGVDATKIPQALSGGFADSKPLQITGSEMATETFEPIKWRVQTLLKDLTMAIDLSYQKDSAIPMSKQATQLMQQHGENGFLEQDPATLIKLFTEDTYD
jgi:3-hydroxyisobutyrate dehydrogenase